MAKITPASLRKETNTKRAKVDRAITKAQNRIKNDLETLTKQILPALEKDIDASLEKAAKEGQQYTQFSHYEYSMADDYTTKDEAELLALKQAMNNLDRRGFNVKYQPGEGYNGDGNNMKDFYTSHDWTVSW